MIDPQNYRNGSYTNFTFSKSDVLGVSRFTRKTRITGETAEIPERPKNNRELLNILYNCIVLNI